MNLPSRTWGPRETFSVAARSTFFLGGILIGVDDGLAGTTEGDAREIRLNFDDIALVRVGRGWARSLAGVLPVRGGRSWRELETFLRDFLHSWSFPLISKSHIRSYVFARMV